MKQSNFVAAYVVLLFPKFLRDEHFTYNQIIVGL